MEGANMESFNKENLRQIRKEIDEVLAVVAANHGISIEGGNITYQSDKFTIKLTATINKPGAVTGAAAADFERYCGIYGLVPSDLGRSFMSNGNTYKLVGLKMKNRKYPFIGERSDGKRFKFSPDQVRRFLGK
jgi:hypothetical protein